MPIYVKENDVAEFLDMPSAIQALRDAFAARARAREAVIVPRTRWVFGDKRLNVMGGGLTTQQRYALKSYGSSAYHVLLYGPKGLLAIVESEQSGSDPHRRGDRRRDRKDDAVQAPARSR